MQARERERLMSRYNRPELSTAACVAKCAAGLLVITLIAVIGQPSSQSEIDKLAESARFTQVALQGDHKAKRPEQAVFRSRRTGVAIEHVQVEKTVWREIP